jgi:hypothetical protein
MWLIEQKAILTKNNMLKRKWQRDSGCYFCGDSETNDHLLFKCLIAKVIWGVIAICFHKKFRLSCHEQFWPWINKSLPGGEAVYMFELAAVCWAICFENSL